MKRFSPVLALSLAVAGLTPAAATAGEPADCDFSLLARMPEALHHFVEGTDPSGRYQAGDLVTEDSDLGAVGLWTDGKPQLLTPYDVPGQDVEAVNGHGHVVGSFSAGRVFWAYVIRDGRMMKLGQPNDTGSTFARAINDAGQVAGDWYTNTTTTLNRAVTWSAAGHARVLPLPTGFTESEATGIGGDGTVVGDAYVRDEQGTELRRQPVVWTPDGRIVQLDTGPGDWATVTSMRAGIAAGAVKKDGQSLVARWNLADGTLTTPTVDLPGQLQAQYVNAGGDLVVRSADGGYSYYFLSRDGDLRGLTAHQVGGLSDTRKVFGSELGGRWYAISYDCVS